MLTIDIQTARRFILGKQGLWPGWRWRGIKGTEQAMRAIEYLQLTQEGKQWIANLHSHVFALEHGQFRFGPHPGQADTIPNP